MQIGQVPALTGDTEKTIAIAGAGFAGTTLVRAVHHGPHCTFRYGTQSDAPGKTGRVAGLKGQFHVNLIYFFYSYLVGKLFF